MKQFWLTILAVFASFFGVRSRKNFDDDIKQLSPLHIIVAGFIGVFIFIAALMWIVNWVVK